MASPGALQAQGLFTGTTATYRAPQETPPLSRTASSIQAAEQVYWAPRHADSPSPGAASPPPAVNFATVGSPSVRVRPEEPDTTCQQIFCPTSPWQNTHDTSWRAHEPLARYTGPSSRSGKMARRGWGQGAYVREHYYKYVGEGQGEFDSLEMPKRREGLLDYWWAMIPLLCCCTGVPALALARAAMTTADQQPPESGTTQTTTTTTAVPTTTTTTYDCEIGYSREKDEYAEFVSLEVHAWCCNHFNRACTKHETQKQETAEGYDCEKQYSRWKQAWSADKQAWCCEKEAKACLETSTTTTEYQYNCTDVPSHCAQCMENEWSTEKRSWCCQKRGLGCMSQAAEEEQEEVEFDCEAGSDKWLTGWSPDKKEWCCKATKVGCNHTKASQDTRTKASSVNRSSKSTPGYGSNATRKSTSTGTTSTRTTSTRTTTTRPSSRSCKDLAEWPSQARDDVDCGECKRLVHMGKPGSCDDFCQSFGQVCFTASRDKSKARCQVLSEVECSTVMGENASWDPMCGCEDPREIPTSAPTPQPVDCISYFSWPDKQNDADCGECRRLIHMGAFVSCGAYCSSFGQSCFYAGVNDASPSGETECKAVDDASCGDDMQDFHEGSNTMICGCEYPSRDEDRALQYTWTTLTTTTMWYDCTVGPWPPTKSHWCCLNEQKGCGEFTCDRGPWPQEKKDWCCAHLQKGCDDDDEGYYDCSQGPWPAVKRDWCCHNRQVGCESRPRFQCDFGPWPAEKIDWCCQFEKKGCVQSNAVPNPVAA